MTATPEPFVSPPPPSGFARWWQRLLPIAVVVMALALLLGVFDTSARPAWIFVAGASVGLVGVASLIRFLVIKSRRGLAAIEATIEERFGEDTKR